MAMSSTSHKNFLRWQSLSYSEMNLFLKVYQRALLKIVVAVVWLVFKPSFLIFVFVKEIKLKRDPCLFKLLLLCFIFSHYTDTPLGWQSFCS